MFTRRNHRSLNTSSENERFVDESTLERKAKDTIDKGTGASMRVDMTHEENVENEINAIRKKLEVPHNAMKSVPENSGMYVVGKYSHENVL